MGAGNEHDGPTHEPVPLRPEPELNGGAFVKVYQDALRYAKRELSLAATRLLLHLMEHTWGYHRDTTRDDAPVTFSQLERETGLSHHGVVNGVKELRARGVVTWTETGSKRGCVRTYTLTPVSTWKIGALDAPKDSFGTPKAPKGPRNGAQDAPKAARFGTQGAPPRKIGGDTDREDTDSTRADALAMRARAQAPAREEGEPLAPSTPPAAVERAVPHEPRAGKVAEPWEHTGLLTGDEVRALLEAAQALVLERDTAKPHKSNTPAQRTQAVVLAAVKLLRAGLPEVDHNQEWGAAGALLKKGFTPAHIVACFHAESQNPRWEGVQLSLAHLHKSIGPFVRSREGFWKNIERKRKLWSGELERAADERISRVERLQRERSREADERMQRVQRDRQQRQEQEAGPPQVYTPAHEVQLYTPGDTAPAAPLPLVDAPWARTPSHAPDVVQPDQDNDEDEDW